MYWEDALDALAEGDFAYGEGGAVTAVLEGDADAFKDLNAFLVAFLDFDVNLYRVAGFTAGRSVRSCFCSIISSRF
jgi:hypothetical protein